MHFNSFLQAIDENTRIIHGSAQRKDCKLVTPDPGNDIRFPEGLFEDTRHFNEGLIAFPVAHGIIDLLQAVKISVYEEHAFFGSFCDLELLVCKGKKAPHVV